MIDLLTYNGKKHKKIAFVMEKSRKDELYWEEDDVMGEGGC
jgi:hypothetical protein